MRRLIAATLAATALALTASLSGVARAADADPTLHQIYAAAEGGHLDQAQQMIEQVLRDHPKSAKAHFVQAELFAREGKLGLARAEFKEAETLEPGLPFAKPQSVQALKGELGLGTALRAGEPQRVIVAGEPRAPHFPWGTLLVLIAAVGVLWLLFRRRQPVVYTAAPGPVYGGPAGYGGAGPYGAPPMGPMAGPSGGLGSTIAGGLASGLAVGAGVVAGEELAHHFLDGNHAGTPLPPPASDGTEWRDSNGDMGGSDFGVGDAGSWDDGGSGGGGDWN